MLSSPASRSLFEMSEDISDHNSMSRSITPYMPPAVTSPTKAAPTAADNFSRELTRLQEEQVIYIKKIEQEKERRDELEENIQEARLRLRLIRDKTKDGNIVKDHEIANKKLIGRLEYQLQMSKIKLSTSRNENTALKGRVVDLRREKILHVQILNDLAKEITNTKRRSKYCQKEILTINEKKHKVKMNMAAAKQKMVRDMEDFSSELVKAKQNINNTQANIMLTIREKLQQQSTSLFDQPSGGEDQNGNLTVQDGISPYPPPKVSFKKSAINSLRNSVELDYTWNLTSTSFKRPHTRQGTAASGRRPGTSAATRPMTSTSSSTVNPSSPDGRQAQRGHNPQEAELALKETEFTTVEELLQALQQSEERVFTLYNETQSKHEEVEKMELENKHLECQVQEQMKRLHELEGNQERVKEELEKNIQYFQSMISKYDADYQRNLEGLSGVTENLMSLLKNVAVDESAIDQQLLSTGINDRNVHEFLGLIEQRIDDLIQMSKAANHQALTKEDFLKSNQGEKIPAFQMPIPPTIMETEDDEEMAVVPEGGEPAKLQPLNIPVLKEIMNKKVQKMSLLPVYINSVTANKTMGSNTGSRLKIGGVGSGGGGQSTASLRSVESNKSM